MNISELASPGINLDTDLNKDLFLKDESLNPRAMTDLADLIERFSDELGLKDDAVEDVVMTGSNAGFAHTPDSTIVINVVVPPTDDSIYRELLDAKMALFMAQNNPQVMGYPADISVVDTECSCGGGGMYSVRENSWHSVPKRKPADPSDLAVLALGESWLRTVELVRERPELTEGFEQRWNRFERAAIEGSCERLVIAEMGSLVKRALGEGRMILESRKPKPVRIRESFRNGFAEEDEMPAAGGGGVGGTSGGTKMILEKEPQKKSDIIRDFFDFCIDYLEIDSPPDMRLKKDPAWSERNSTFGRYLPQEHTMELSLTNRHINDICRTLAHELVHVRQHEIEDVPHDAGETGSHWENEANAMAGVIMRDWGRAHPELFSADTVSEASGYIPTRAQAKDPRWEMGLSVDVKPGEIGRQANKLDLETDSKGHPALLHKKLRNVIKESAETDIPDWLIDLYDRSVRAQHAGGRGASPADKRRAAFANKALVKGIDKCWGEDGWQRGYELAMAHKAKHGYDDLDDYLEGETLSEGATDDSYLWQARVKITHKETGYTGYIPVTVAAPDMRRARILIASMYGVKDKDIGSTTKVKRK